MFSFEVCEISKNTFSYRTPPVAASVRHQMYLWKGRTRNPPSVFNSCVKPSLVPTQTPPTRSTKQAHSLRRNAQPDEIEVFI